ncbi:VOC family protein [Actinocrispum sp. NPDC049592]|uniref:VOC family protein n=1 Tax=Actinocrispum sp. NPDC049592 TaxID=3154835 RepID=UPI00343CBBB4
MNVTKLQFVTVPVADHGRAREFYVGTLGFDVLVDRRGPGGEQFLMVAPKGAETGVVLADVKWEGRGTVHLQFHTEDVDGDILALREKGVEVSDAQEMPWGRTASFVDVDGNPISLLTPSKLGDRP